jgi:hypothetical protein
MEFLLFWAFFGLLGIYLAQKKGINKVIGFLAGILLGPLVFLIYFVKQERMKCPMCAEFINKGALICRYCKYQLNPIEQLANK